VQAQSPRASRSEYRSRVERPHDLGWSAIRDLTQRSLLRRRVPLAAFGAQPVRVAVARSLLRSRERASATAATRHRSHHAKGAARQRLCRGTNRMSSRMEGSTNELTAAFGGCRSEAGGDRAPAHYSSSSAASVSRAATETLADRRAAAGGHGARSRRRFNRQRATSGATEPRDDEGDCEKRPRRKVQAANQEPEARAMTHTAIPRRAACHVVTLAKSWPGARVCLDSAPQHNELVDAHHEFPYPRLEHGRPMGRGTRSHTARVGKRC
jgi:hypothetical protein